MQHKVTLKKKRRWFVTWLWVQGVHFLVVTPDKPQLFAAVYPEIIKELQPTQGEVAELQWSYEPL